MAAMGSKGVGVEVYFHSETDPATRLLVAKVDEEGKVDPVDAQEK